MGERILFVENVTRAVHRFRPGTPPSVERAHRRGACLDTHEAPGVSDHRFADGAELLERLSLPADSRARADRVLWEPTADPRVPDAELAVLADEHDVGLTWALYRQDVAVGPVERLRGDERLVCTLEVAATAPDGTSWSEVLPWTGGERDRDRLDAAVRAVRQHLALTVAGIPDGGVAVLLEPGRSGAFFHELVGHPLEGDVVATASSYLALRAGRRVAPEWLTVRDAPATPGTGFTAELDDEGVPVSSVDLLRAGVVAGSLADRATAELLGLASSGHGRRLDYRYPALPRMWHTEAVVEATEPARWSGPCLRPRGLGLRSMNLLTGDFEFELAGGVLDLGDGTARRTGPATLAGNGLTVLAALRPGSAESRGYLRASRGCGKLGQFPLPVSFANGGVLIPPEAIHVARV